MTKPDVEPNTTYFEKTVEWLYVKKHLSEFGAPLAGLHETISDAIATNGSKFVVIEFKKGKSDLRDEKKKYPSTRYDIEDLRLKNEREPNIKNLIDSSKALEDLINREQKERENNAHLTEFFYHPHFFIFGITPKGSKNKNPLDVKVIHYWSTWINTRSVFLQNSSTYNEEKQYESVFNDYGATTTKLGDRSIPDDKTGTLATEYGLEFGAFASYVAEVVAAKGGVIDTAKGGWMYASVLGITPDKEALTMTMWEFCQAYRHKHALLAKLCDAFEDPTNNEPDDTPTSRSENTNGPGDASLNTSLQSQQASGNSSADTPSHRRRRMLAYRPPFVKRLRR